MKLTVRYHPLCANEKYPGIVDLFRDGETAPVMSANVDAIGDLFKGDDNREYYHQLEKHGEVHLTLSVAQPNP